MRRMSEGQGTTHLSGPGGAYGRAGMAWAMRTVGPHLHPGSEEATVTLAQRAERAGFPGEGPVLEVASALGGPARFLARRYARPVVCVDMDPVMHRAAAAQARLEEMHTRCWQVLARTERLPLAGASMGAAWSQDAMCHMDKAAVVAELARVLKPGAVFAFTDWVAQASLTRRERQALASLWGFPSLLRIPEYVALLDAAGFDILLAEDRLPLPRPRRREAPDDGPWFIAFEERFGRPEIDAQLARSEAWAALVEKGRGGYAMFLARRRAR